jgi:hypothetical protein
LTNMQQGDWYNETERMCSNCSKTQERDENECALCKKVYFGEYLMCDTCEKWHCQPCSGLTDEQIANIENLTHNCRTC